MLLILTLLAQSAIAAPLPPEAHQSGIVEGGEPRLEASLLADHDTVSPGQALRLGVRFQLDPDWHVYWKHSGQAGLPPKVTPSSTGMSFGEIEWPSPEVFKESDGSITTYGFANEVLLTIPAEVAKDAKGSLQVDAAISVLACARVCIPGKLSLSRTFPVGTAKAADAETVALFDRARLPHELAETGLAVEVVGSQSPLRPGDRFQLAIGVVGCAREAADCKKVEGRGVGSFVPEKLAGVELLTRGVRPHPTAYSGVVIDVEGTVDASFAAPETTDSLRGLLRLERGGEPFDVTISAPLSLAAAGAAVVKSQSPLLQLPPDSARAPVTDVPLVFLQMLFFAFLGGMILNLMPCVLPVLFLKITSVARLAHNERRVVLREDSAYAAGIMATMLLLGTVVVLLRSFGSLVGWGFQFQSPVFSALLSGVLVVFALNLFGVFEVEVGAAGFSQRLGKLSGLGRSFLEGVLMVVVATPCTAPFLGTAVGFALVRSPTVILLTFFAIGAGLAAPFVLLSMLPGLGRLVPRPGAWMLRLKQALGFALLGTVVWLLWLVGRMSGVDGMVRVLVFLVCLGALAWGIGLWQRAPTSRAARFGMVTAIAIATGMGIFVLRFEPAPPSPTDAAWTPYSPVALSAAVDTGRAVFVDFTADWCITCKVNEAGTLQTPEVHEAFTTHDVLLMRADWTRHDDAIRDELMRFGKAGVPMYLVYGPGARQPIVLPEVLTPGIVLEALQTATSKVAQGR